MSRMYQMQIRESIGGTSVVGTIFANNDTKASQEAEKRLKQLPHLVSTEVSLVRVEYIKTFGKKGIDGLPISST